MVERRKIQRGRTYLGGRIAFNNRYSTIDCLVRNMSPVGAKLVFAVPVTLPDEFDLMIANQGPSRRSRTVWRGDAEAGVAFALPEASSVVSIEAARKIRMLEKERDRLLQRIAQLSEPMC